LGAVSVRFDRRHECTCYLLDQYVLEFLLVYPGVHSHVEIYILFLSDCWIFHIGV
jgi:hypothetical protein